MSTTPSQDGQPTYMVTARKWRPKRFVEIVGQEHVTQTLRNAVQTGRVHHAYIFNGPRGVGKTTTARILAKALNCQNIGPDAEPCNVCPSCTDIATGRSMDVIEIDGASNNSVEDVRKLRENARYPPVSGTYKMYIIDEIHMLSTSAFNALLKTLEEPPRHLIFVFATTEPHKVPATILSRCQRFDFRRMQIDDIAMHLRHIASHEGITIDEESLTVIAKKGDGSMRDSQSIFDQVVSFCGMNVSYAHVNEALNLIDQEFFFAISRAVRQHDIPTILEIARQVFIRGYDLQECLIGLAEHFRNILTVLATGETKLIETSKNFMEHYKKESVYFTQGDVLQLMNIIITTEQALRYAPQPRLRFEFALIQMAKMDSAIDLSTLLNEIAELKKKLETGIPLAHRQEPVRQEPAQPAIPTAQAREKLHTYDSLLQTPEEKQEQQMLTEEIIPGSIPLVAKQKDNNQATLPEETPTVQKEPQAIPVRLPVSADILSARWETFLVESQSLDKAIKRMAITGLLTIEFSDNEVCLTGSHSIISNTLIEKKSNLTQALQAFYGGHITVRIKGADEKSNVPFDDYLPGGHSGQITAPANDSATSSVRESSDNTAGRSIPDSAAETSDIQKKKIDGSSDAPNSEQASPDKPANGKDADHPLDRAIIELFGAVEISIR